MKGVADRTPELMNEFQKEQFNKSYQDFQHFLVVKIERLEDEIEALNEPRTGYSAMTSYGEESD